MKKRKRKGAAVLGITAVLLVVVSLIGGLQVHAAERDRGQIRIVYACDNGRTRISGAWFSVLKVADTGEARAEELRSGGISASRLLEDYQKSGAGNAWSCKTNSGGEATFENCPAGVYLIWQSGSEEQSTMFETALPFLTELPLYEEESGRWNRTSCVYPKTTRKPAEQEQNAPPDQQKPEEPQPVQEISAPPERGQGTGDDSYALWYILISVGSLCGLLTAVYRRF